MKEQWRPLKGHDNYFVSSLGRVMSTCYGRRKLVKPIQLDKERPGVLMVSIHQRHFLVHRLVATAFLPNPDKCQWVLHKDGDKSNNRADNLQWSSSTGSYRRHQKPVVGCLENTIFMRFESIKQAAEATGMSDGNIWLNLRGKTRTTTGRKEPYVGMKITWRYANSHDADKKQGDMVAGKPHRQRKPVQKPQASRRMSRGTPVVAYIGGKMVRRYDSVKDACADTGVLPVGIYRTLSGMTKKTYGKKGIFKSKLVTWRYENED